MPVPSDQLLDPNDIHAAKVSFGDSYLVDNTWVSGIAQVELSSPGVGSFGADFRVPISRAVLVMNLNQDHGGATGGMVGGVVPTEAFIAAMRKAAGHFDAGLCTGSTLDSLANQPGDRAVGSKC